ncbi:MAG TPA: hypothetical protein VLD57_05435, partial [Blastocatellia bacterium]|nr:hypothetical protein [Blastocatellia bacterium]
IDAWDEIAGAFQAGSQPVSTSELMTLNAPTAAPVQVETGAEPEVCQLARNAEEGDCETTEPNLMASPAASSQTPTARVKRVQPAPRSLLGGRPIELASVKVEALRDLEFRPIEISHEIKSLAINREGLLSDFKKRTMKLREAMRFARTSQEVRTAQEVRVLVEKGKTMMFMSPTAAPTNPCPPRPDVTPKVRKVRVAEMHVPETETGEI